MKKIALGNARFTLVDDEDFDWLNQWKWHYCKSGSGKVGYARNWNKGNPIRMHRLIMGDPDGKQIDHINGDGLDNQRKNLRTATASQNNMNRKQHNNQHGFKGIYFYNTRRYYNKKTTRTTNPKNWKARIKINRKFIHLGSYSTKEEAAKSYDRATKKYFGEFAHTNFST